MKATVSLVANGGRPRMYNSSIGAAEAPDGTLPGGTVAGFTGAGERGFGLWVAEEAGFGRQGFPTSADSRRRCCNFATQFRACWEGAPAMVGPGVKGRMASF
eukprot:Polyplicarium_translucidae@DN2319_c0_g1_i2.p2